VEQGEQGDVSAAETVCRRRCCEQCLDLVCVEIGHRTRYSLLDGYIENAATEIRVIEAVKSVSYTPTSHPFTSYPFLERLIGTVRREYLDQTLFWNSLDLERKLSSFRECFSESRVHSSPVARPPPW